MDKLRRSIKCALYSLYKLITKPKGLAILFIIFLYMEETYKPLGAFLSEYGETVNGFGLYAYLLSDSMFVTVAGMGLILLLGDAPFFDEAQQYVLIRGGKAQWVTGQILYMAGITAAYLLILMLMQHLLLMPNIRYQAGWGRALRTLSETDMAGEYGIALDFPGLIMSQWSPRRALALELLLRWMAYMSCALIVFILNLVLRSKLGVLVALFVQLLDIFIDLSLGLVYTVFSISALARLANMDFGYNPYLIDVEPSMAVLCGSFLLLLFLAYFCGRRCDLVSVAGRD